METVSQSVRKRATAGPLHARSRVVAWLVLWPMAVLTLVTIVLALGVWKQEYVVSGPFPTEVGEPRPALILPVPEQPRVPWWRQPLTGDSPFKPTESILELQINGQTVGPPHKQHGYIRQGLTTGFSHWGPYLYFSLPRGVQNDSSTVATLRYSIRPRHWITTVLTAGTLLLAWYIYRWPFVSLAYKYLRRGAPEVLQAPYAVLTVLCCSGALIAAIYLMSSFYAFATGWALPTTALLRWTPLAEWLALNEPYLGYLFLTLAGFGALLAWLANTDALRDQVLKSEQRATRIFAWCGFPIVACAFVLSISAMWVGLDRPGDLHGSNIGGLIPFNDAHGHLASAFDQARDGSWIPFAQRRPLAAAFRATLLFFSDYSFAVMVLLQACLVAAAACLATYAVSVWRGIWAGLAFLGLVYIYARIFVPTSLTEPLGLFWALLSIPFFVEAIRSRSTPSALVGFAINSFALMTRMGSMFTIPLMLLWLVWQFGKGGIAKIRIGLVAIAIVLGIYGLKRVLLKAYGTQAGELGGNFSYVICGVSLGTNWQGCTEKLAAQGQALPSEEAKVERLLYGMAWQNFKEQPQVLIGRLLDGIATFAREFPDVLWMGYGVSIPQPDWVFRGILTAMSLAGLALVLRRRARMPEATFWALLWAGIILSSSIVYFDDGARTLAASQPLIALFFAIGMSNPALQAVELPGNERPVRYGAIGLALVAILFLCLPWVAYRLSPTQAYGTVAQSAPDEALVLGGRRMSGFLVVADDQPLRHDIPTLHLHDFATLIRLSDVEQYQGLLDPVAPATPFGFIYAPRLDSHLLSARQFIVPLEVMERRDVPAWRFKIKPWQHKKGAQGDYWVYVTKAEPWKK
jgi:hypothetical protein